MYSFHPKLEIELFPFKTSQINVTNMMIGKRVLFLITDYAEFSVSLRSAKSQTTNP